MDATEEKELAEEFEIGGFPTLKLFVNGDRKTPTNYDGTHTHAHTGYPRAERERGTLFTVEPVLCSRLFD